MMRGRVYLGLPAYNEEIALPRLLARIEKLSASLPHELTVVVYDDGSTDATARIARGWQQHMALVLIDGIRNKGLGAGLSALVNYAVTKGGDDDILVVMDCDDTHDPMQVIDMLAAMDKGADVVVASRFARGARVTGVPLLRRLTAVGAVSLFKLVHPVKGVWDYTCGYRAYRIGALQRAGRHYRAGLVEETGFACMTELLLKLNAVKLRFAEIPLHLRYDQKPTASKMAVSSNIGRMLGLLVRWRLRGLGAS
jgi:dolichol-phosphate mannosyltransferase